MGNLKPCHDCGRERKQTDVSRLWPTAIGYRSYQKQCWDCYHDSNEEPEFIPKGHIYVAEYYNSFLDESIPMLFKIGITGNVDRRMCDLGDTLGPLKVKSVFDIAVSDPNALEAELHEYFKEYKITGEWFNTTKDTIINQINERNK